MEKVGRRKSSKELKKDIARLEKQRDELTRKIEKYRELATIRYIEEVMPIVKEPEVGTYNESTKAKLHK